MTLAAAVAIAGSAALGLLVSLSMFLMIGATSGVTFNVVGHVKTVLIMAGGVVLFGDAMCAPIARQPYPQSRKYPALMHPI